MLFRQANQLFPHVQVLSNAVVMAYVIPLASVVTVPKDGVVVIAQRKPVPWADLGFLTLNPTMLLISITWSVLTWAFVIRLPANANADLDFMAKLVSTWLVVVPMTILAMVTVDA